VAGSLTSERTHVVLTVRSSLAALFLFTFTIAQVGEGAALDVGVSGGAAGLDAGVSAGVGSGGLSVGADLSSGGNGVSVSGNLGPSGNGGTPGAGVGAAGAAANAGIGANGASAGGSLSGAGSGGGARGPSGGSAGSGASGTPAGSGTNSASPSTNGSGTPGVSSVGTETSASINGGNPSQRVPDEARTSGFLASIAPTALATSSLAGGAVPSALLPIENGRGEGGWFRSIYQLQPLQAKPGTPLSVVQSCRKALVSGALRYGATHVDVASAGRAARLNDGGISAPVEARILFQRGSHVQVRQARITCRLDQAGRITAMF
jgi:hypothetical protein